VTGITQQIPGFAGARWGAISGRHGATSGAAEPSCAGWLLLVLPLPRSKPVISPATGSGRSLTIARFLHGAGKIWADPAVQPLKGHNLVVREAPAGGWLTLPLDRDLIFVLMPDHKRRDVVAFSDGLQGAVVGFAERI